MSLLSAWSISLDSTFKYSEPNIGEKTSFQKVNFSDTSIDESLSLEKLYKTPGRDWSL
jgi:hypothetical protein